MASKCISKCVEDVQTQTQTQTPVRATYENLYKWPESDMAFLRSLSANSRNSGGSPVVDSVSCRRQLYLRSYTFSHKNKKKSRARRIKERMVVATRTPDDDDGSRRKSKQRGRRRRRGGGGGGKCTGCRKAKEAAYEALASIFRRLQCCTTKVDIAG